MAERDLTQRTLRSDAEHSRERIWDLVVIDEAQKIKNHDSDVAPLSSGSCAAAPGR